VCLPPLPLRLCFFRISFWLRRHNSLGTIVCNQCANEVLQYAIKSHRGLLVDDDMPKDIYDNWRLPPPPRPGNIDVIVAGFPWCVLQVLLPMSTTPACHVFVSDWSCFTSVPYRLPLGPFPFILRTSLPRSSPHCRHMSCPVMCLSCAVLRSSASFHVLLILVSLY
jgi:hypothetical protein